MDEPIIFWHRINSGDYATKLFDHFLHVKRGDSSDDWYTDVDWVVWWGEESLTSFLSMDSAFDFAEQFYRNEMTRRTDEPCL